MRSNCVIEGWRRYRELLREHRADPTKHEPYLLIRPSRLKSGVPHVLVGTLDSKIDAVRVESFKPVEPVQRPWWRPAIYFAGEWKPGDTKPADLDELDTLPFDRGD